jgi:hypothetical protein
MLTLLAASNVATEGHCPAGLNRRHHAALTTIGDRHWPRDKPHCGGRRHPPPERWDEPCAAAQPDSLFSYLRSLSSREAESWLTTRNQALDSCGKSPEKGKESFKAVGGRRCGDCASNQPALQARRCRLVSDTTDQSDTPSLVPRRLDRFEVHLTPGHTKCRRP